MRSERRTDRRFRDVLNQCGIERTEEEHLAFEAWNRAADFGSHVILRIREVIGADGVDVAELAQLGSFRIPRTWPEVGSQCAVVAGRAGLGNDLDDATVCAAILRF